MEGARERGYPMEVLGRTFRSCIKKRMGLQAVHINRSTSRCGLTFVGIST
jgi:hypothetical protein